MSLESPELEVDSDNTLSASERRRLLVEELRSKKEAADENVEKLEREMESLSIYLKSYSRAKGHVLKALHTRHLRARKLFTMSVALSLSSLTLMIRGSHMASMKDAMPWITGLGAASLTFSLFYLRDFLQSFKDPYSKWEAIEADVSDVPRRPELIEETGFVSGSVDLSNSERIEQTIDELEMPRTSRLKSY